jgi:hypothetical protein
MKEFYKVLQFAFVTISLNNSYILNRVLFEKLFVAQPIKNFPSFYLRFNTMFTRAYNLNHLKLLLKKIQIFLLFSPLS